MKDDIKNFLRIHNKKVLIISGIVMMIFISVILLNINSVQESSQNILGLLIGGIVAVGVTIGIILLIVLCFGFYFLPVIIAISRKHSNLLPILLVNLFFGFLFIGWIVALIWAFSDNTKTF